MHTSRQLRSPGAAGFTLIEVVLALGLFSVISLASFQAMSLHRMVQSSAEENQIVASFLEDYIENCRQMDYVDLAAGQALPDGPSGGRAIPAYSADQWNPLTDGDLLYFPDLAKLVRFDAQGEPIYPDYQVQIQTINDGLTASGNDYKIVTVTFRWTPSWRAARGGSSQSTRSLSTRVYNMNFY